MKDYANDHKVCFYTRPDLLADSVFNHISPALESLTRIVVIASGPHLRCIQHRLRCADFEPEVLKAARILIERDADECLETFYVAGAFDELRFRQEIAGMIASAKGPPICAYGEMVDTLCKRGRFDDAIELEKMWNRLAKTYQFSLLCGYDSRSLCGTAPVDFCQNVSREHTHILAAGEEYEEARFTSPIPAIVAAQPQRRAQAAAS